MSSGASEQAQVYFHILLVLLCIQSTRKSTLVNVRGGHLEFIGEVREVGQELGKVSQIPRDTQHTCAELT